MNLGIDMNPKAPNPLRQEAFNFGVLIHETESTCDFRVLVH